MLKYLATCLLASLCFAYIPSHAQSVDSLNARLQNLSGKFLRKIQKKTASLDQQLTSQTQSYVQRMTNQEARLNRQLSASDSNAAKQLFAGSAQRYAALSQRLRQDTGSKTMLISGAYQPYTDSLRGTLAFLQQHPQMQVGTPAQLQKTVSQLQALQAKMQDATQLQQYMQQRQALIQQYITQYTHLPSGITNTLNGYKAQAAYYQQQVSAYKAMLNDPDKLFQAALTQLNRVPAFSGFMQRHSALSALMPAGSGAGAMPTDPAKPGQGLPGRDEVLSGLQGQLGKNGPTAESLAQKSTTDAVSNQSSSGGGGGLGQLGAIGGLLSGGGSGLTGSGLTGSGLTGSGSIGNGGGVSAGTGAAGAGNAGTGNPTLNPQKTKSILKRLEFGVNLQSTPSSYFFPATTDIGVSLGYKLNDKNRIGIGASYKIGWAGDLQHLQVSSQGVSVRSFLDISIGGTWFASGGLEYNYQPPVYTLHMLRDLDNWEPAGLIGLTKVLPMKTKLIKNTKIQLLWNFLSYSQVPTSQPFLFRVGYSF